MGKPDNFAQAAEDAGVGDGRAEGTDRAEAGAHKPADPERRIRELRRLEDLRVHELEAAAEDVQQAEEPLLRPLEEHVRLQGDAEGDRIHLQPGGAAGDGVAAAAAEHAVPDLRRERELRDPQDAGDLRQGKDAVPAADSGGVVPLHGLADIWVQDHP